MLQRGFGEKRGRDHHVWVYRKGASAEQTVTRLFGVEKHFYGPEGSHADEKITDYENESQSTIQEIRMLPNGSEVDPEFVATLIAHLEMRTAFLRENASTETRKAVGEFIQRFKSPKELRAMMVAHLKNNPDELDKLLGKGFIHPGQREGFAEIARRLVETLPDDEIMKSMEEDFGALGDAADRLPDIIRDGQNKALGLDVTNLMRTKSHLGRNYSVFRPEAGSLILPDTTLAFIKQGGASPFSQKDDDIEAVILPIASDTAIIGKASAKTDYSLKAINRLLAGCSFKAFLAKENSSHFQGLTGRIGKYARLINDRDLARVAASFR